MSGRLSRLVELLPRPLDPITSIKLKLSVVLLGSGGVGIGYLWYQYRWLPPYGTTVVTVLLVLLTAQVLAHGMTRPLREMTSAARAMARGDYRELPVRATARDEVGQLATAFNQMAADLAAADQQRRELIANVSHELRTPVTALRAMLENAVDGVAPAADVLPSALRQTERLAQLVADFLDLSRIDAGALSLHRETFPVRSLLADAVAEVSAARPARFDIRVEPAELTVHADPARLRQVVVNLLDNACRHGPPAGTVRVSARADGDRHVLEVADDGPGIPPDQRDLVFQRFTRGERAGSIDLGGTGLGLAIARWVVELHDGRITIVDSAGCTVRVSLPATPNASAP